MIGNTLNSLHNIFTIAGLTLILFSQMIAAEGREDIVILRDVPPHVPYRGHPVGKPTVVDPSPDEQLLAALGLNVPDESAASESNALSDADIAAFTASPQPGSTDSQANGPGFINSLFGQYHNSDGLHATQSLPGLLSGGSSPGAVVGAATADIAPNINRALAPLNGLLNLR